MSQLLDDFNVLSPDNLLGELKIDQEVVYLEPSWKDVVEETEEMTNRQKLQQEGVWELLTSEVCFVSSWA